MIHALLILLIFLNLQTLSSTSYLTRLHLFLPLAECAAFSLDVEGAYARAIEEVERKLRDPQVAYIIEAQNKPSSGGPQPVILRGTELDLPAELPKNAFLIETAQESLAKSLTCSYFFSETKDITSFNSVEEVMSFY